MTLEHKIPGIGSYYGGLCIKQEAGKYFWGIEDWQDTDWEEIPKNLYDILLERGILYEPDID